MLSLSNVCSDWRNPMSEIILTAAGQKSSTIFPASSFTRTGFTLRSTQTAERTSRTGAAGFFMAFTSAISFPDNVSKALRASFRAGIASASASSHSFLMAFACPAASLATASSPATTSFTFSVFADSSLTTIIISPTSLFFSTSFGCRAMSSCFMPSTDCSVVVSFSRPTSYLDFRLLMDDRFSARRALKVWISSRKEVGVE
mmetsp:Transcript_23025/g.54352  ORF Transcript_23025/g.54352 Transcript_23025/m.54352 type:complete len:202 (-) Transcript_23025:103-708(-)